MRRNIEFIPLVAERAYKGEIETGDEAALIVELHLLTRARFVCIQRLWGSIPEKPFASGGAALPSGRKLLFGEAIWRKSDPQRRRSQEESTT